MNEQQKILKRLEKNSEDLAKLMRKMTKKGATVQEVIAAGLIATCGVAQNAGESKNKYLADARGCWDNVARRLGNEAKASTVH